jgi:hypothetical protein
MYKKCEKQDFSEIKFARQKNFESPPQMRNARITSYSWCAGGLLKLMIAMSVSRKKGHNTNSA